MRMASGQESRRCLVVVSRVTAIACNTLQVKDGGDVEADLDLGIVWALEPVQKKANQTPKVMSRMQ